MPDHHSINYIELPSTDLAKTKSFYGEVFGWTFQDWGDTYVSFQGAGIDGGFEHASQGRMASKSGALVILYSDDLDASEQAVRAAGGEISVEPFEFPGGKRFHFVDPSGNELAIWKPQAE
jgi:predicted enzyme related to lactoylglutathione lyase